MSSPAAPELRDRQGIVAVLTLALTVDERHRRGRLHLEGLPEGPRPAESPPSGEPAVALDAGAECVPPELRSACPLTLPREIVQAAAVLQQAGVEIDPREIDLYALGVQLCRALTGESPEVYRASPRAKSLVPPELRPVLEGALGCDGRPRFREVRPLLEALKACTAGDPGEDVSVKPAAEKTTRVLGGPQGSDTSGGREPQGPGGGTLPFATLGGYEIRSRLGSGGMGDVYEAYEPALDRVVALKVLPSAMARSPEYVQRFRSEATAAARLVHPNIVPIYRIGEDGGSHFFAMQCVKGESLSELLARRGRLSVAESIGLTEQVLSALSAAHARGLVHRDVKPGNVLIDATTHQALLGDFGLVKSLQSSDGRTATGVVLGTLEYLAPEQGRGRPVDGRADLYSVGVMLYRMLSGQLPFEGDSPTALIFQHVYEAPTQLSELCPDVPSPLAGIVMRLLAKQPEDRFATADDVLRDLRASAGRERASPPSPQRAERDRPQTRLITAPVWSELPQGFWEDDRDARPETSTPSSPAPLPRRERGTGAGGPQEQTGWQTRVRDRMATLFRRHAPEAMKQLQSTQQQMDGAIGEYERRQKRLQRIEQEAVSVLAELTSQAAAERLAATEADRQTAMAANRQEIEAAQDRR